jgi:protocatechuate 3,4-dioxygenase beta subunit
MAVKKLASMVFCSGFFVAAACAQSAGTGAISGTVVDGESGDAIRKAIVTLTLQGTPRRWATIRTDGDGRFQFSNLPAGKYGLRAEKAEGTAIYGANNLRELSEFIALGEGETRGGIKLRFLHAASLSGRVFDSDGDPVADTRVSLLRPGRNFGAPALLQYRGTSTDERGEYRFSNVDPGRYYIRAMPARRQFDGTAAARQARPVDQYYGGARDFKEASPVHVAGGETLAGLDFHLVSEPAVEVQGLIAGVPDGLGPASSQPASAQPASTQTGAPPGLVKMRRLNRSAGDATDGPEIQVMLIPADLGPQRWRSGSRARGPEHRFHLGEVSPGRYRIEATFDSGEKTYGASQVFDLHPDYGEIVLTLAPAVDIQGTLRVEGDASRKEPGAARAGSDGYSIQLTRPDTRQSNITADVASDGHFSLPQVLPGEWQLTVDSVPPGFLKSAQYGDKDVRFTTFEAEAKGGIPLNIVVSMRTAAVEGEVDAGSGQAKRAGILLAPVGPYHNLARFYYGTPADDTGKFHFEGIAPGKYKIFALEKMAAASFRNPEAADQLDTLGTLIDLAEGTTVEAHPKLIPTDRAAQALQ